MKRPDLLQVIPYAVQKGLRVAMTPSGTPLMTRQAVTQLKEAGLSRLAVSLDGSSADIHDRFRQVPGLLRLDNGLHRLCARSEFASADQYDSVSPQFRRPAIHG